MKAINPVNFIRIISDAVEKNVDNTSAFDKENLSYRSDDIHEYDDFSDMDTAGEYFDERDSEEYISGRNYGGLKRSLLNDSFKGMEDRKNDWLACQIREEQRILKNGTLSDLGAAHSKKCDAQDLKTFHHLMHLIGKEEM